MSLRQFYKRSPAGIPHRYQSLLRKNFPSCTVNHCFVQQPRTWFALIFRIARRYHRSDGEDVGLRSRLVLVVETYRAVWAEVVSISRLRRMTAFDSVHSAPSDHFTFSLHDEVDLFCGFVVMREVRTSRARNPSRRDWSQRRRRRSRHASRSSGRPAICTTPRSGDPRQSVPSRRSD